ncbi:MAG TPA: protein disulfide isomerase family protein [Aquella sp.]|nr:protein disulfide isomerase family protein [Aquella sp.]
MFKIICGIIAVIIICYILCCIFQTKPNPNNPINSKPSEPMTPQLPPPTTTFKPKNKANAEFVLYNFSDPRCQFAQQFKPVWDKIANYFESTNNLNVRYIDTSLPENENLAFYYNISSSPTVILATPTKHDEFEGSRNFDRLKEFVMTRMNQS